MSRPGRSLPPGKSRYPLYRMLGRPQGRSGQVPKTSSPPGFDTRNVKSVASRYTDWATRPTCYPGKAINIAYSQCVSVDLDMQYAKRTYRIMFPRVPSASTAFFPRYLIKCTIFGKNHLLNIKCLPWFSLQPLTNERPTWCHLLFYFTYYVLNNQWKIPHTNEHNGHKA